MPAWFVPPVVVPIGLIALVLVAYLFRIAS
jgi:hypothetical protein